MRIQCSSFWPSMFTSQSSLNSFSSVKLHSYFCYSEVCPHRFLKSQHARNSCQMSASFRVTTDNLLSQHKAAEQSIHVVLFLIVWWIGKTLCKIQQLHWWEKLLNSTCIVKKDHLLSSIAPICVPWYLSGFCQAGSCSWFNESIYVSMYGRKRRQREIRSRALFYTTQNFPVGLTATRHQQGQGFTRAHLADQAVYQENVDNYGFV